MSTNSLWQQKGSNLGGRCKKGGPACLKLKDGIHQHPSLRVINVNVDLSSSLASRPHDLML